MEQLNHNMLFRWSVGLPTAAPVWVPTVFRKNSDRLRRVTSRRLSWLRC